MQSNTAIHIASEEFKCKSIKLATRVTRNFDYYIIKVENDNDLILIDFVSKVFTSIIENTLFYTMMFIP